MELIDIFQYLVFFTRNICIFLNYLLSCFYAITFMQLQIDICPYQWFHQFYYFGNNKIFWEKLFFFRKLRFLPSNFCFVKQWFIPFSLWLTHLRMWEIHLAGNCPLFLLMQLNLMSGRAGYFPSMVIKMYIYGEN